jgi:hypothetical protein
MNPLLFAIFVVGVTHTPWTRFQTTALVSSQDQLPHPVLVIADGTPGWQHRQADSILDVLNQMLSSRRPLLVAWFDAEPVTPQSFAVRGINRDVVVVRPRTAMKDAIEIGFAVLADTASPRAMIVIAQQQFYPTAVPNSRLLGLARHSATRVFTIHLPSKPDPDNGRRHIGRSVANGFCSVFERLVLRQRAYSERDTARFLKLLSDQTGGLACEVEDEQAAIACARAIATAIERP